MHNRLKADHDDLRLFIQDFAALLGSSRPDRMTELFRLRTLFYKCFRQHLATEDAELRALATPERPALHLAQEQHARKQRAFFLRYSDHIKRWTPETIQADWEGYRAEVTLLARDHKEMMEWEERELHPLIVQAA